MVDENTYSVEEILSLFKFDDGKFKLPSGRIVEVSRTLRTFKQWGTTCSTCKLVGEFFRESQTAHRSHLKLYGCKENKLVLMTMDHIIPLSKCGSNHIDNLQTMCEICNSNKGDETELEPLTEIKYSLRSIKDFILNKFDDQNLVKEMVEDFHCIVNNIPLDNKDYLLRVSYDKLLDVVNRIKMKHGVDIPLNFITKVPARR